MIITTQPLNPPAEEFDTFYANTLHFLNLPNNPVSSSLLMGPAQILYNRGIDFTETKKILSAYRDRFQKAYRELSGLKELLEMELKEGLT